MNKGSSTIELLIALAVLVIVYAAVIGLAFGGQFFVIDSQQEREALELARNNLARSPTNVSDISQCARRVESRVSWQASPLRSLSVSLATIITDLAEALALGRDCVATESASSWSAPALQAQIPIPSGAPRTLDVLNGIAYIGADQAPFVHIYDGSGFIAFDNGFGTDVPVNDLDVAKQGPKTYLFAAMDTSANQLAVIDVSDIRNPVMLARRTLKNVLSTGSQPSGYRIYYYDKKVYILTRETSGPEFHIFDIADPANPIEFGAGTKLTGPTPPNGTTVNDFAVENGVAYMAAEKDASELLVYDVSNPLSPRFMPGASVNLPGSQNGSAIFASGGKVYLGRESVTAGPEFYIFDTSHATTVLGTAEIGRDVLGIRVVGDLAFILTDKSNQEFQVWDVSNPAAPKRTVAYHLANPVHGAFDYESDRAHIISSPNLSILHDTSH